MAQQLNLYDPRFAPQPQRYAAHHGLLGMLLVLGLCSVLGAGLRIAASHQVQQAQQHEGGLTPLRQQLAAQDPRATPAAAGDAELQTLRQHDAGQRRILAALQAGVAGVREGPSDYLAALARQANGAVWITGFSISEDGQSLELEGRMLDSAALPDYLRRLNAEPRFRGRPFAQLNMRSTELSAQALQTGGSSAPATTDFALRSSIAASGAQP
ncbi:PilN domain-containing protein [Aquabacterium sp. OR-4]|uniref:PilN domain-containing protein n=1 Tax=Aquabacterium sp. OR-4 TaxID=2978127 RepID=UPI0021B41948|nr:PilN domain-containing protein [Aquabacterium sp. OR-4]MDT7836881.1 PilN domain-containing protein [Aquabacterium sp. OR-4]